MPRRRRLPEMSTTYDNPKKWLEAAQTNLYAQLKDSTNRFGRTASHAERRLAIKDLKAAIDEYEQATTYRFMEIAARSSEGRHT